MRPVLSPVRAFALVATSVLAGPAHAQRPPSIVYLDFSDGTETVTSAAVDDAPTNRSYVGAADPYPAFTWPSVSTGAESRAAVVARIARRVHELFLPYNVLITLVRPAQGPYTKVLIGGGPRDLGLDQNLGGVAYMDCGNRQDSNVVFAFPTKLRGNEHGLVVTIAQETAHAFGLEHTMSVRDLMHPLLSEEQASFPDEDSAVFGDRLCGNTVQNSHRQLLDTVGPWRGDEKPFDDGSRTDRTPPRLALVEPRPGAEVAQPFALIAAAEDESGIDHLVLTTDPGGEQAVLRRPPFGFSLGGFPAGPLTVTLTAYDRSGNTTTVSERLQVGASPELPGGLGCSYAPGGRGRERAPVTPVVTTLALALLAVSALVVSGLARRAYVLYKLPFRKRAPGHKRF